MHDYEIIALYETRNEQAVAEMQTRYGNYGFCIAYNILGSSEDAEECVNDGYLRLWNSIPPKSLRCFALFGERLCATSHSTDTNTLLLKKETSGKSRWHFLSWRTVLPLRLLYKLQPNAERLLPLLIAF